MMCSITKAMPNQFIDGKCHIKKWKDRSLKLPYLVIKHALHMTCY